MSSNIQVQRICQYCSKEFTAFTTVTKFCSNNCAKRAYKDRKRAEKVQQSNSETQKIKTRPIEDLKRREFLTVTQVSKLIGCSRQNVYKLINSGKLKATNILEKKTIVKRTDLDELFNKQTIKETESSFDVNDCYTIKEIENKFGVSRSFVQKVIERNNIPKKQHGRFALVPKQMIDGVLR